mmetsp:Transcript_14499/g.39732  ORF Transcript_14499/g.39732 Transcript_14499/m.39732 type:complete len:236 (+) Transcript_14499:954-1661(+)
MEARRTGESLRDLPGRIAVQLSGVRISQCASRTGYHVLRRGQDARTSLLHCLRGRHSIPQLLRAGGQGRGSGPKTGQADRQPLRGRSAAWKRASRQALSDERRLCVRNKRPAEADKSQSGKVRKGELIRRRAGCAAHWFTRRCAGHFTRVGDHSTEVPQTRRDSSIWVCVCRCVQSRVESCKLGVLRILSLGGLIRGHLMGRCPKRNETQWRGGIAPGVPHKPWWWCLWEQGSVD